MRLRLVFCGSCRRLVSKATFTAVRAAAFKPTFQKHKGLMCHGVQVHVTDRSRFKPFLTGVAEIGVQGD